MWSGWGVKRVHGAKRGRALPPRVAVQLYGVANPRKEIFRRLQKRWLRLIVIGSVRTMEIRNGGSRCALIGVHAAQQSSIVLKAYELQRASLNVKENDLRTAHHCRSCGRRR